MRDERTKLLNFVNTWMDWSASNLDKSWQKWRDELEKRKRKQRNGEDELGLKEPSIYRDTFIPGWLYEPGL